MASGRHELFAFNLLYFTIWNLWRPLIYKLAFMLPALLNPWHTLWQKRLDSG